MEYLKVKWLHDHINEPIWFYGELNEDLDEIRKIEIFRDGTSICAELDGINYIDYASVGPWPPKAEIESDPQFQVFEITKQEFETLWGKAIKQQT